MKSRLIYAQAALFLIVITIFSFVLVKEKGGFLFYPYIEKKINHYYEEHYSSLIGIKKEALKYHKEQEIYSITYSHQKIKDLTFSITYQKGKIKSDYEKSYVEGGSIFEKRREQISKKLEKIFLETDFQVKKISFYKLTEYLKKEQEKIKKEKDLSNSALYSLELIENVENIEDDQSARESLSKILKKNNIIPNKITLTLKKRKEERIIVLEQGEDDIWTIANSAKL